MIRRADGEVPRDPPRPRGTDPLFERLGGGGAGERPRTAPPRFAGKSRAASAAPASALCTSEERRRFLEKFRHPDLIPLLPADGRAPLAEDGGEPLDRLLRRWGGAPLPGWRRRCPHGIDDLLSSFCRLARLLGALEGLGWPVPRVHPRWLRLDNEGAVRLRAVDLLDGDAPAERRAAGLAPDGSGADEQPLIDWAPYLAPEILLSGGAGSSHGEQSGVYSLAAVLHHCLAGAPPWRGRSEAEVADRLLAGAEPTPIEPAPDLPRGIAPLLRDALSLDPRQRPARFRGFAAALEAASRGERPRSTPAYLRGGASPLHGIARAAAVALVLLLVIGSIRSSAGERSRATLLARLDTALAPRPFPLHGEDPPVDPLGAQVLRDSAEEAARWPRDAELLVALGWARLRAGEGAAAEDSFLRAALWDPDSAEASISLGIARLERGDRAGALDIERGLVRVPRTPRERMLRGAGELYLHRFPAAVDSFRRAIGEDGPSFAAWFHLAYAAHLAGDDRTAEAAVAASAELREHDIWLQWLTAERLTSRGDREAAIRRIEESKPEWVESPALLLRGAVLYQRLGLAPRAGEWWERVRPGAQFPPSPSTLRWSERGQLTIPERSSFVGSPPPARPARESPPRSR